MGVNMETARFFKQDFEVFVHFLTLRCWTYLEILTKMSILPLR
jgi:hypothetical protein